MEREVELLEQDEGSDLETLRPCCRKEPFSRANCFAVFLRAMVFLVVHLVFDRVFSSNIVLMTVFNSSNKNSVVNDVFKNK
jgi:hypothetical protein